MGLVQIYQNIPGRGFLDRPGRGPSRFDLAAAPPEEIPDVLTFARMLGIPVHALQAPILTGARHGIVNCTRQFGKSTMGAVKVVHRAMTQPGCLILVLAPIAPAERRGAAEVRGPAAAAGHQAKGRRAKPAFPSVA
jgi:hypothetical protein